jgi:hypothetical protein
LPAKSKAQQALFAIDLTRKREGKPTKLGLAEATLEDFASTPTKNLPKRVKAKKGQR